MNTLETLANARRALLAERNPAGHWEGELSTSALSTATAIAALHFVDASSHRDLIEGGLAWLAMNQNDDGGWGDTVLSFSNISTTLLCWSVFGFAGSLHASVVEKAEAWIQKQAGSLEPSAIKRAVVARYGKDKTFSVPILMLCALGGRLGPEKEAWRRVLPLPFELAAVPRAWFSAMRFPVVSYALPALIAIGYARFVHAPPCLPLRLLRQWAWKRTSLLLQELQPSTGGFLEATPLTSFVTMALASSGQKEHPVVPHAVAFLQRSVRVDGSWPIDTNLATWGTTLATKALLSSGNEADFPSSERLRVREWLMKQQYKVTHPFTDSPPGGWAWTDLAGGVPDADDTPGAMLALRLLGDDEPSLHLLAAINNGARWLLGLQNHDGGIPTFCRGWGTLPFDRSSPDLTAHTLRAWHAWLPYFREPLAGQVKEGIAAGVDYLRRQQDADGAWTPLWFGNQHVADETNRTYGTTQVLLAMAELDSDAALDFMRERATRWLLGIQHVSGGWGGDESTPPSIEETALALNALARLTKRFALTGGVKDAADKAIAYLARQTAQGRVFPVSPIGFYFAKLWYYEKLYPMVWTVEALEAARDAFASPDK